MDRYTHHRRTQDASVKGITRLEYLQDRAICMFGRFRAIHRLVQMGVERFPHRIHALDPQLFEVIEELLVDQLESLAVAFVFRFAMGGKGILKAIEYRDQSFDRAGGGALGIFKALLLNSFSVIVEVRLEPEKRLTHLFQISSQLRRLSVRGHGSGFTGLLEFGA